MITVADLSREGTDLVVTWEGADSVVVSIGPAPDQLGPVLAEPEARGVLRLRGVATAPRRYYVRLEAPDGTAVVAAERRLSMEGPVNFRDLGGYRAAGDRRVRWGAVFRSDSLESLTEADIEILQELGVRLVCDLRRDEERAVAPSAVQGHDSILIEHLPIGGIAAETRGMQDRMMRGEIAEVTVDVMVRAYRTILELHPETFGTVVTRAADPAQLPMIIHCTAGKDRTGVASALILGALGVADTDILADYELTTKFHSLAWMDRARPQLEAYGIAFAKVEAYFAAGRPVMAGALEFLRERWGGADGYLTEHAGLPAATLERLRSELLEDASDR